MSVGALLRDGVALRQLEDIDWDEVTQQMAAGELVADVSRLIRLIQNEFFCNLTLDDDACFN